MTSLTPKNKVIASSSGALLAELLIYLLLPYYPDIEQYRAAITGIVAFGLGYLVPDRKETPDQSTEG